MSTMKTPRAKLDALLALLNSAGQEAIAEYEQMGEIPSMESAHPLDSQSPTLRLKRTLRVLEGACEALCTTLAPPAHTLLNRTFVQYEPACIRVAIEAKVADVLVNHPEGIPVAGIAKKTGIEEQKLARILRFLATKHCFCEVRPNVFANNRLSFLLVSSTPFAGRLLFDTTVTFGAADKLYACLTDPEYGPSMSSEKCPFMYNVRGEGRKDLFDYMKHHPHEKQLFTSAMVGLSRVTGDGASLVKDFPWNDMPPGSTVCDVGSGVGAMSLELAKAYPHLNLTLQDYPHVIEQARSMWSHECPTALEEHRVDFVPFDFFKEGPVKGQDIYYMRNIIHDWQNAAVMDILNSIKSSMRPGSRLLIHEYVLPGSHRLYPSDATDAIAPEPLLPNFGAGNIRAYYQDINMMILINGKERSLDEFKALGAEAGLEFVKVWDFVERGIIEFKFLP